MDRREEFSNIPTEPPAPNRNGRDDMRGASGSSRTTEAKPFPSTISDDDFVDEEEDYYYASNDENAAPRDLEAERNWWERQSPVAKGIIVILPVVMIAYFGILIVLFITSTQQAISATPTSIGRNTTAQSTNTLPALLVRSPLAEAATPTLPNNNIPTVTPRPTPTPAPTPTLLPTPAATTVAPATTTTAAPLPTTTSAATTTAPNNAATATPAATTIAGTATPTLAPAKSPTTTASPATSATVAPTTTSVAPAATTSAIPVTTTNNATSAAPTATKTP